MKRYFRNIIAMLLAAVFVMSAVPAGAMSVQPLDSMNVVTLTIPTDHDENQNGWGRPDLEFMGGWVHNGSWRKVIYCRDSRSGQVVYCIEPGRPINADTQYGDHDESYWENHPGNDTIGADTVKKHIGRILSYGYLGNGNPEWNSANSAHAAQIAKAIATQLLVWEVIVGERDESFGHIDATQYGKNNVIEEVMEENPIRQQILSAYNSIVSSVRDHLTLPSFCTSDASNADPFNMEWNGSAWVIELADANNVLSDYEFTGNVSGMTFTKSGNKLTVISPAMPEGEVQINASRIGSERRGVITWTGGNNQTTVSYGATVSDPVNGCFKLLRSGAGSLHLVKTSEDGNIAGIGFTIEGQGQSIHRVTDANGIIDISTLVPGTYTVTEDESELYAPQTPQTVTIVSGETATVTFHNTLRKGGLHLVKTSEDGNVSGIGFTISGNGVNVHRVTDANGVIDIADLQPGTYTVTEDESELYAPQAPQTVTVSYGETATVSFYNTIRRGGLHLIKTAEDGNVAGIGFTISGNGKSIHRITDDNGVIDVNDLLPGVYTVTEDGSDLYEPQEPKTVTVSYGETATVTFRNILRRGGLKVSKTAEDGLVEGLTFHLYGTSFCGLPVDEYAVTNEKGIAVFENVLIGSGYILEEVDTPDQYVVPDDQTAVIEWNEVSGHNFENKLKCGGLHLVKTAEDGNVAGIGFTIEGNGISIHRFTDENGVIDIDGLLPGVYTVTEDASELYAPQDSQTVTVVADKTSTVTFNNTLRRGALKVTKTAEDGLVEGLIFHLYGTADCGLPVDEYAVTDASGTAVFENILIGSGYVLEEVDTPDQYVVPDDQTAVIEWNEVSGHNFENKLKRGSIKGYKLDREIGKPILGALFGLFAEDEVDFIEANALMLAKSDENGVFLFENIICGSYLVCELRPAEGYLDNDTVYPVTVDENGAVIEITVVNDMIPEISTNAKIDGEKDACATDVLVLVDTVEYKHLIPGREYTLRGVLMDKFTGEAFTENGEKIVSEVSFIPEAPCGSIDMLFTFDARLIKTETRIVVFECLYSDGVLLASHEDINDADQTVTVLIPRILTEASIDGQKEAFNTGIIKVEDKVSYFNLTPGREYTLRGRLMDKATGRPFNVNGRPVTAQTTFTPDARNGEIILTFAVPSECFTATTDLVVFERLYRENTEIASHENINDESQTVRVYFPKVWTTATIDGQKEAFNTGIITVEDKVFFEGLIINREYTIRGVLMDKATGEPFMVDGEPVSAEVTFVAEASSGEITLSFTVPSECFDDTTDLVAFERLFYGETEIASHEDIDDESQTVRVYVPFITTTAVIDGQKEAFNTGIITVEDKVFFEGLIPGREYTVRGVLMDKATGEPFMVDGEPVSAEVTFVAEASSGEITLSFTVPSECFDDTTDLVAFERLFYGETEIASHEDIDDESQTVRVYVPFITTTAVIDGQKEAFNTGIITVEDKVFFEGLIPGREYTVRGVLMNKATGEPFTVDGEPVSAEVTFVAEASNGEITLSFTVPSEYFDDTTDLVAFERLFCGETEIASHEDIEDESQTVRVYVPSITTTATIDGQKEAFNTGIITVEDKVFFEGLIIGREYTVRGVLMNKATGEPFMVDGEPVSAEVTFIAEASDGEVVLTFTFDASLITEETQLVAFERLFCCETEIASHEDIEDEAQTVTVKPKPDIPKTGDTDEPDNIGVWIGLCAIALGGAVACVLLYFKNKKNGGEK